MKVAKLVRTILLVSLLLIQACSLVPQSVSTNTSPVTAVIESPVMPHASTPVIISSPSREEVAATPLPTLTIGPIANFSLNEFSPLTLSYRTDTWTLKRIQEYNQPALVHSNLQNCLLREQGGTDIITTFVATTQLDNIVYDIYKWETDNPDHFEQLYFADDSAPKSESNREPVFEVRIPYHAAETCVADAEKVLATLR